MTQGKRLKWLAALIALAGIGALVWWQFGRSGTATLESAAPVTLTELPVKRWEIERDWRDARVVPGGVHVAALGAIPEGGALRLTAFPKGFVGEPPLVSVFAGDRLVAEVEFADATLWEDRRIDLAAYGGRDLECRVLFSGEAGYFVARCELAPREVQRPNVLVFLIDTLRPDHLGCYGYERDTSPNIDALASESVRFTQMISQSSWTRPAVASLFTSTYPAVHEAQDRLDVLRDDLPVLAELFRDAGYETQGFMSNPNCLPAWGFDRGFDRFIDIDSYTTTPDKDAKVVDAALAALESVAGRPWFFYVHVVGPHEPYEPPAPYDTHYASDADDEQTHARNLYDGEIVFTDRQFGRVIETMKRLGIYDNSIVIVISDHGEEFWEHGGTGHGTTLFDEQIRIPYIMKLPHGAQGGTVVDELCQIIDAAPTILDTLSMDTPGSFQGTTLNGLIDSGLPGQPMAYTSLFFDDYSTNAARSGQYKYINDAAKGTHFWYDLLDDPGERAPLSEAPEGHAGLARFASQIAASGNDGLHILVTGSLSEPHTIAGTVRGAGLGEHSLRYLANNAAVKRIDEGVAFKIVTSLGDEAPFELEDFHENSAEQNNAHLRVAADPNEPLEISVTIDGNPAPDSMVFVGAEKSPHALNETTLTPGELVAGPELFFPSALPRRLAVYVWYVPGADTLSSEDLDPGMKEALGAMGYL